MSNRWWSEPENAHGAVLGAVETIKNQGGGTDRRKANWRMIGLYENRDHESIPLDGITIPVGLDSGGLTFNVCRSCVDVLSAKIAPNRPKPEFLTVDGDFSDQQRAKDLQRFVMGCFTGGQVWRRAVDVFLDAGICDLGAMKLGSDDNLITYERVFPNEILVDERGAQNCDPHELYQEKWVATDVLVARFPKMEEQIRSSSTARDVSGGNPEIAGTYEDQVQVIEAWHLPAKRKGKDGKHVIVVKNAVLFEEDWKDSTFPFAFLRWSKRRQGFYGQGLVEQLHGIQEQITELVQKIAEAHRILGVPWVLSPRGAANMTGAITNEMAQIIEFDGQPPTVAVHAVMAPEVYQHLDYLYNKAFEDSGISQLSAVSKKPAGVESGVALRTLLDTETQRFALLVDAYQDFILDIARETVKQARRMGNAESVWSHRQWTRKLKWQDLRYDEEDRFDIQLWPTNLLPDTPAGKLAYVEQMITMGLLTPDQGQGLLDFPDVEAFQRTNQAAKDLVEMMVEKMLTTGEYEPPTEHLPLAGPEGEPGLAVQIVQSSLLRGKVNGWPEDKLSLLVQWLNEAAKLVRPPEPPMMAPPGGPPMPMEGGPPPEGPPPMPPPGMMPPQ